MPLNPNAKEFKTTRKRLPVFKDLADGKFIMNPNAKTFLPRKRLGVFTSFSGKSRKKRKSRKVKKKSLEMRNHSFSQASAV